MALYRATNFLSDRSTNVSNQAVNAFVKRGAIRSGDMDVVPNGINCSTFRFDASARVNIRAQWGVSDDIFCFVAVGRLEPSKDYPNLIAAFSKAIESNRNIKLFIVGDGSCRGLVQEQVEARGINDYVVFLGARRDIPAVLSAADCLVLSSIYEGFGMVLAEAMACERVVIATDSGGTKQVVGDSGFVVPVSSSTALAGVMTSVVNLPEIERFTLGVQARKHVLDNFSLDSVVSRWLEIYVGDVKA